MKVLLELLYISNFFSFDHDLLDPLMSSVTYLYFLKTSESICFSDVFRGYKNVTLDIKGLR